MTLTSRGALLIMIGVIALAAIPFDANAQSRTRSFDREAWERWREQWEDSEGIDEDERERIYESRRESSATRRKIDNLDDDRVDDLFIPILFGIELRHLFPNFGDPRDGGARSHLGLDIMAPEGAPIVSPTEAVVIRTGRGESAGNYVYTANPGGETFAYMHLDEIADIRAGDELDEGDLIGYVGNTGNASGGPAHLHFEIREGRDHEDPFPRITRVFPLEDKIDHLEGVLEDAEDEEELAEFIVENYRGELLSARALGMELPEEIEDVLGVAAPIVAATMPMADLDIGAQGTGVVWLQTFLIARGYAIPAGATGYFGTQTQSALAAYQAANGITPSVGYYGPKTRAHMAVST